MRLSSYCSATDDVEDSKVSTAPTSHIECTRASGKERERNNRISHVTVQNVYYFNLIVMLFTSRKRITFTHLQTIFQEFRSFTASK